MAATFEAFGKAFGMIYIAGLLLACLIWTWGVHAHADETVLTAPVKPAAIAPVISTAETSTSGPETSISDEAPGQRRNPASGADVTNTAAVDHAEDFNKDYLDKVNAAQQAADAQKRIDRERHDKLIEFYMRH